jgi:CheY-like chemotaxis protein
MYKLLLADDSVTIQRVIELTFSGEDIQVIAVNDGEQAIARIPIEQPDIVLADIGMPKKGGYDVAAFVKGRSELEHIPSCCWPARSSRWTRRAPSRCAATAC